MLPIAVVVGTAAPVGIAAADEPGPARTLDPVTEIVAGGPGRQWQPRLNGSLLVWTDETGGTSEIRFTDLVTGDSGAIDNDGQRDMHADAQGSTVVFRRVPTSGDFSTHPIMVVDVRGPGAVPRVLAPEPGMRRSMPSIGGDVVAFEQSPGSTLNFRDVCVADLTSPDEPARCLTDDGATMGNHQPSVSPDGRTVVFQKCLDAELTCDVYSSRRAPDGSWSTPQVISDPALLDEAAVTDGSLVAWSAGVYPRPAGTGFDIRWSDVDGSGQGQLVLDDATTDEYYPELSAGTITFTRTWSGSGAADLYVYRIEDGELFQLTDTPGVFESHPGAWVSPTGELWVAWQQPDEEFGSFDIHLLHVQLPPVGGPNRPPVLSLPDGLTVDATSPAGAVVEYEATADDDTSTPTVTCSPVSGATFAIGTTTVECSAVDDHGATTPGTFDVTVRGAREQLADLLVAVTGVGPGRSLEAKIRAAVAWLPDRALPLACEPLRAFIREVQAQSGRRIPADTADLLVEDATRIRAVLACP